MLYLIPFKKRKSRKKAQVSFTSWLSFGKGKEGA
jgi:hypothetical protein